MRITTNDKKYHFSRKKKPQQTIHWSPKPEYTNSIQLKNALLLPYMFRLKSHLNAFFTLFIRIEFSASWERKNPLFINHVELSRGWPLPKKREEENAVHNFRCCFSWFGGMPSIYKLFREFIRQRVACRLWWYVSIYICMP